jgi:hypothetical protein
VVEYGNVADTTQTEKQPQDIVQQIEAEMF